jgi:hypothetical protein
MTAINNHLFFSVLQASGFYRDSSASNLFLIDKSQPVTPAYRCRINRKGGRVQFGGSYGMYFLEFERTWRDSLTKAERKLDFTLPLVMLIDNYMELVENGVFTFSECLSEVSQYASQLYRTCLKLPMSIGEFNIALIDQTMLGKPLSDYLHIFDYHADGDLYFRKSERFVRWFADTWPEQAQALYRCLTASQRKRLALP